MDENDFPMQKITIYHKRIENKVTTYERYVLDASYRNTSIQNRNKTGVSNSDNALIRIFDIKGYNNTWYIEKDDVIVNKEVTDTIEGTTPITQLSKKYGRDNIHEVVSIDKFIFGEELDHIKIGAK